MIGSFQSEITDKIGKFIQPRLDKYESIFALIALLVFILIAAAELPLEPLFSFTLVTLSVVYFFSAFAVNPEEKTDGVDRFIIKLAAWSCSVGIIGLLFRLSHWPGGKEIHILGLLATGLALVGILYTRNKKPESDIFNNRWIIRVIVIAVLSLFLILAPTEKLIEIGILREYILVNDTIR